MSPSINPFNQEKYNALMDGLECVELPISKIGETYDFRIESEFYKKEYIEIQQRLEKLNSRMLSNGLSELITDGTHYTPDYKEEGVPFLSAINVQENYLDLNAGYKYISKEQHKELSRRVLPRANDVLLRKVGVGMRKACVIPENTFEFSIFVSVALIRSKINPYILSTYINSKYGQTQLLRFNKGISQPDLHLEDIGRMLIPTFSDTLTKKIHSMILDSDHLLKKSQQTMQHAANILEDFLDLTELTLMTETSSVKTLSESFGVSARLDAEYYQTKYEHYDKIVKDGNNGFTFIYQQFDLVNDKCDRLLPQYCYAEIGDVNVGDGVVNPNIVKTEELPDNAKIMTRANDILVSTVRPNRGAVAILNQDDILASGAFTVLREKGDYPKEVLQVLLRLEMYRDWMLRYNVGTSYPVIKSNDILNLPIPVLDETTKTTVVEDVKKSFILRQEAKQLLELSVRTIELAVETDEETAISWIESQNTKEE